jgi:predicted O-methyltransferase YrrM
MSPRDARAPSGFAEHARASGRPASDPTALYRLRDAAYAADLLVVAIAELDLLTHVAAAGRVDAARLCASLGLDPRAADVMITYLAALGLLERRPDGAIEVSTLAAEHLVGGAPLDMRAYFDALRERPGCAELLGVLRSGRPAAWASAPDREDWAGRLDDVAFARRFTAAMDARGAFLAPALCAAIDDLPSRRLLDVGGASGVYACALAARRPGLRATILERPPVDAAARTLVAEHACSARVEVVTGDMFDALPAGHDLHLFSHVLHDWSERQVRALLSRSFAALAPGGWLVDHDAHVDADKSGPLPVAEYSVLLMHSTHGKCWSVAELDAMLTDAGFAQVEQRPGIADRSVVVARKPG